MFLFRSSQYKKPLTINIIIEAGDARMSFEPGVNVPGSTTAAAVGNGWSRARHAYT